MYENKDFKAIYDCAVTLKAKSLIFVLKKIEAFYNEFNKRFTKTTKRYNEAVKAIFDQFPIKHNKNFNGQDSFSVNGRMLNREDEIISELKAYIDKLDSIKYLDFLSEENRNVVFVGPNGCGKTTLLRKLKNDTVGAKIYYFLADRVLLVSDSFQPKRNYDSFMTDLRDNYAQSISYDNQYQGNHISRQFDYFINLLERERNEENEQRIFDGKTERIIQKWNELIKDRELFFKHGLCVRTLEKNEYPLRYLSSGEKAILYFLIGVLLLPENDFYFIDEPENNLNPAIVSMLWDFIEKEKPNSIFVYLTHDSDFVASRLNAKTYWIEKYNGSEWAWRLLPENKDLPQQLMVQLVGNRQPVIFCESENEYKYDSQIFKIMFPEFKIVSCGGCDKVQSYSKAYKMIGFPSKAFGIIDCDYKNEDYLNGMEKDNIYHMPFHEIENFLVSEEIVLSILKRFYNEQDFASVFERLKEYIIKLFIEKKNQWITRHVAFELRDIIAYRGRINCLQSLDEFKKLYAAERKTEDEIDLIASKYSDLFEYIVSKNDYNLILRYLDYKGLLLDVDKIVRFKNEVTYEEEVLAFLKTIEGEKLLRELREKYLPNIQYEIKLQ